MPLAPPCGDNIPARIALSYTFQLKKVAIMPLDLWLAFLAASTALLLIPGPTVLLVLSYALSKGRSVAVASAAGVAFGDLVAMTASLLGLGALVLASATLFTALKWVGAAYLVWLGIKLIRSAPSGGLAPQAVEDVTARQVFRHTAAVTALNPKSIAFFIAFVPQFITPTAPLLPQFTLLIATFVALAAINAIEAEGLLARSTALGAHFRTRFAEIGARTAPIRMWDIRGLGAMLAVEFVTDFETARPDSAFTKSVIAHALKRGLILLACGMHGNAVRIMVPLTASDAIIEEGLAIYDAALGDACAAETMLAAE